MIKKTLVILFIGIFASAIIPSEYEDSQKNTFRNSEPILEPIPNQSIQEEGTLEYSVIASDPDEDDLTFSVTLDNDAYGEASFNANNLITQLIPFLISLSVEFKIILCQEKQQNKSSTKHTIMRS